MNNFMSGNSMDKYSWPIKTEQTKLGIKYWFDPRKTKPGRELRVVYDQRFPFIKFELRYSYYVRFLEEGNTAGNHYHIKKEEVFIPLEGKFEVHLEDIVSKEREVVKLDALENTAFYIKTKVAHKVVSKKKSGILLVMASSPSQDDDEVDYKIEYV